MIKIKNHILSVFRFVFGDKTAISVRRFPNKIRMRKYRKIERFNVNIGDVSVAFSTEDDLSKLWFFPRYEGGKLHEEPVTLLLYDILKDKQCFVDIGTCLGWYTCLASKVMLEGLVYGFEMDEEFCTLAQKNLKINNCANASVIHGVVSDISSEKPYPPQLCLDSFFKGKDVMPDVVKIDVEGAEYKVLKGMEELIQEGRVIMFIEVHPNKLLELDSSSEEVIGFLLDHGYVLQEIVQIRKHYQNTKLKPINQNSSLSQNTMLYAYKRL